MMMLRRRNRPSDWGPRMDATARLLTPVQRWVLRLSSVGIPALTLTILLLGFVVMGRYSDGWDGGGVHVQWSAPFAMIVNEEQVLRVAVRNDVSWPITVTLSVENHGPLAFVNSQGSSHLMARDLQPGEQREFTVTVFIPHDFGRGPANWGLGQSVGLDLRLRVDQSSDVLLGTLPIKVAQVPGAGFLLNWVGGLLLGLLVWTSRELWEATKRVLESE